MEPIDIKRLTESNPLVDASKLQEGLELIAALEASGQLRDASYNLEPPLSRKAVICQPEPVTARITRLR